MFSYQKQWLLAKPLYKIRLNQSHSIFGANCNICLSATAPALLSSIKNKGKWGKRYFGKAERSTVIWTPMLGIQLHSLRFCMHLLSDLCRNETLYSIFTSSANCSAVYYCLDFPWYMAGGRRGQRYWLWSIICSIAVVVKEMLVLALWKSWPIQTK